jgi:WD40 repeat protein
VLSGMNLFRFKAWLSLAAVVLLCAGAALAVEAANRRAVRLPTAADERAEEKDKPEPMTRAAEVTIDAAPTALVWAGDEKVIVGGSDGVVRLWERTAAKVKTIGKHKDAISALAAPRDGKTVFSADENEVCQWDVGTAKRLRRWTVTNVVTLALSPDDKALVTAGHSNDARVWDVTTGKELRSLRVGRMKAGVESLAFSPDGKRLAAGTLVTLNEGTTWNELYVLDAVTGKPEAGSPHAGPAARREQRTPHRGLVAFSPDGKIAAASAWDDLILTDEAARLSFRTVAHHIVGMDFLKDGETLAVGAGDGTVRLVRAKKMLEGERKGQKVYADDGKVSDVAVLKGQGKVSALAVSPDGKKVAWANEAGKLKRAHAETLRKEHAVARKK